MINWNYIDRPDHSGEGWGGKQATVFRHPELYSATVVVDCPKTGTEASASLSVDCANQREAEAVAAYLLDEAGALHKRATAMLAEMRAKDAQDKARC